MTWHTQAEIIQVTTVLTPHDLATAPPIASGLPLQFLSMEPQSILRYCMP